jgi:hypothetical protein
MSQTCPASATVFKEKEGALPTAAEALGSIGALRPWTVPMRGEHDAIYQATPTIAVDFRRGFPRSTHVPVV